MLRSTKHTRGLELGLSIIIRPGQEVSMNRDQLPSFLDLCFVPLFTLIAESRICAVFIFSTLKVHCDEPEMKHVS